MLFQNYGNLRKGHIKKKKKKTPPEIDKYDTQKNGALQKWHILRKNAQRLPCLPGTELSKI